ncbi:glycoside hydrolase family 16 protein [Flavobacteriaceae bacterium GSB9]|nr:glycoside hydrolase family 16 protein [Flavobacteriaceae bacterium GSB9]
MINRIVNSNISNTFIYKVLSVALVFLIASCNPDETQTVTHFKNMVLAEEFNYKGAPNPAIWNYDIGQGENGWGNNELQYYTDRAENVLVEGGVLKIVVHKEDYEGASYTSGRILTKGLFEQQFGRIEARIKLPWGQGLWPAFWLLGSNIDEVGWPFCGEIDIMENRGQEPTLINGTIHGPGYSGANAVTKAYELENDRFDTGFHIFGIEWGSNYINYYVDDVLYNQITPDDLDGESWVFNNQPFFIILNVAVGGNYVGAVGENTVFPQTMEVDYLRVYE